MMATEDVIPAMRSIGLLVVETIIIYSERHDTVLRKVDVTESVAQMLGLVMMP